MNKLKSKFLKYYYFFIFVFCYDNKYIYIFDLWNLLFVIGIFKDNNVEVVYVNFYDLISLLM